MKLFVLSLFLSALISSSAFAADSAASGNCQLSGVPTTPGMIIVPWVHEKKTVQATGFEDCFNQAADFLKTFSQEVVASYCDPYGPCYERKMTVTLKAVKFTTTVDGLSVKGEVKNAK